MIEPLLAADNHRDFLQRFRRCWEGDPDKDRLLLRLAREAAARAHRDDYGRDAFQGYAGLIAAIQASEWLDPRVRMDPVAQALWAMGGEGLPDPFDMDWERAVGDAGDLKAPMDELWGQGRVEAVCAGLGQARASEVAESLTAWLLMRALPDTWDHGRRFTLMAQSVRLCRWAQWEAGEALLFPAVHCALRAPSDAEPWQWLEMALAHSPIRQDHVSGAQRFLRPAQAASIAVWTREGNREALVSDLLRLLSEGVSIPALYDGLMSASAGLIETSAPPGWRGAVQTFLFMEALSEAFGELDPVDLVRALLLGGLLLRQAARESAGGAPEPEWPDATASQSLAVWGNLAGALDCGDETEARRLIASALAAGCGDRSLSLFFGAYGARNDGRLYSSLDLQFVCAALTAASRAHSQTRRRILSALIHFLSRCEKDHQLWEQFET